MARQDRRYDGGPCYSLERVRACTGILQFRVTRTALYTDGPRVLPSGTLDVFGTIKRIVLGLTEAQWKFAQQKDGGWVDVYLVEYAGRDLWLKLKLEMTPHAKEYAVVVSFHEWDHSRPI